MTADEFVRDFRAELEGFILDAAMTARNGAELSVFLRAMRQRVETKLRTMYAACQPQLKPQTNGQHTPAPVRKQA